VYGVLNLCRVMAYMREGRITSKVEGGEWGLKHIDPKYAALIRKALDDYQNQGSPQRAWDKTALWDFAEYMRQVLELNTPK
jgi:hypothetical protein